MLSTRNRIRPSENACVPFVLNGLVANMEFTKIKLKIQTHGRQAAAATPPSSPSYLYLAPLYRQATANGPINNLHQINTIEVEGNLYSNGLLGLFCAITTNIQ